MKLADLISDQRLSPSCERTGMVLVDGVVDDCKGLVAAVLSDKAQEYELALGSDESCRFYDIEQVVAAVGRSDRLIEAFRNSTDARLNELVDLGIVTLYEREQTFAETSWCADDLTEQYDMTAHEATEFLKVNEDALVEIMTKAGNVFFESHVRARTRQ